MIRNAIILATVVAVIIGAIGVPMKVHACAMAGEKTYAESCSMCGAKKDVAPDCPEKSDQQEKKSCCNDEKVIQQTDPTIFSTVKVDIQPLVSFLPSLFALVPVEHLDASCASIIPDNHSPPLPGGGQSTYLFNSTFLI